MLKITVAPNSELYEFFKNLDPFLSTLFKGPRWFPLPVPGVAGPNCTGNGFFPVTCNKKTRCENFKSRQCFCRTGKIRWIPLETRWKIRYLCGLVPWIRIYMEKQIRIRIQLPKTVLL